MKRLLGHNPLMSQVKCSFLGYPQIKINDEIVGEFIFNQSTAIGVLFAVESYESSCTGSISHLLWGICLLSGRKRTCGKRFIIFKT